MPQLQGVQQLALIWVALIGVPPGPVVQTGSAGAGGNKWYTWFRGWARGATGGNRWYTVRGLGEGVDLVPGWAWFLVIEPLVAADSS